MASMADLKIVKEMELTPREFSQARKQTLLTGACDMRYFQTASTIQLYVLHQIELAVRSVSEEELED